MLDFLIRAILVSILLVGLWVFFADPMIVALRRRRKARVRTYHLRRPHVVTTHRVDPAPAVRAYRERRDYLKGVNR